jgi:hypothetical protein
MLPRKLIHICCCLETVIMLQGCGLTKTQKHEIEVFGKAASTLGASSEEQFLDGRENVIQMKRLRLAIEKKVLPQEQPDGSAATREFYASKILDLDSGLDKDNIDIRVAAVDLLQQYGNLLAAFSGETQEKELNDASDKFTRSLEKFPDNPLTGDEIKGIGELVRVAGGMLVEHEKKETLKKIVPKVSPLINKICNSLENDFNPDKKGVAGNIHQVQDRLASEAIDGLKRPRESLSDSLVLIDGLALAEKNKEQLDSVTKQILKTTYSLRKANEQLLNVITHNKIGLKDIKEFGEDAADLAKAVKPFMSRF